MNTVVPAHAYGHAKSRIVVFSTGNVYPLVDASSQRSVETDAPGPVASTPRAAWAASASSALLAGGAHARPALTPQLRDRPPLRRARGRRPPRQAGESVGLTVPRVNAIWQGDANSYALRALGLAESPARILNVTGRRSIAIRDVAQSLAARFGREARFANEEGPRALLSDASRCHELLGEPEVDAARLVEWTARWVESGGRSLGKPTKFERVDGRF